MPGLYSIAGRRPSMEALSEVTSSILISRRSWLCPNREPSRPASDYGRAARREPHLARCRTTSSSTVGGQAARLATSAELWPIRWIANASTWGRMPRRYEIQIPAKLLTRTWATSFRCSAISCRASPPSPSRTAEIIALWARSSAADVMCPSTSGNK